MVKAKIFFAVAILTSLYNLPGYTNRIICFSILKILKQKGWFN